MFGHMSNQTSSKNTWDDEKSAVLRLHSLAPVNCARLLFSPVHVFFMPFDVRLVNNAWGNVQARHPKSWSMV